MTRLGDRLSIERNRSQQVYLIIIVGLSLCLRNLLLSTFMFLDTWARSEAGFYVHLGKFVGYTGNDDGSGKSGDDFIDLEAGEGTNRINFPLGSEEDRVHTTEARDLLPEGMRFRRTAQSHDDFRSGGAGEGTNRARDLLPEGRAHLLRQGSMRLSQATQSHGDLRSGGALHDASLPLPTQQVQNEGLPTLEEKTSVSKLGLSREVIEALKQMDISVATEIQSIGIPAVLKRKSVMLLSSPVSGKTLAYLLPLVQLIRIDETLLGKMIKPRRPRALIICPTVETSEQVFRVAKSISLHASFKPILVTSAHKFQADGSWIPAMDSPIPIDMIIGTREILHNQLDYGSLRYVVFDQIDTILTRDMMRRLRTETKRSIDEIQTVLVSTQKTAEISQLIDNEFPHTQVLQTSSYEKKSNVARHNFIQVSDSEHKLKFLLQVLKPSLARGNKVMVYCRTTTCRRAVISFLNENRVSTIPLNENEMPTSEQRMEYLEKCGNEGYYPTFVSKYLEINKWDLDIEHIIIFDFPLNLGGYMFLPNKIARLGAKGEVTSLVTRADNWLIKEIMKKLATTREESPSTS